MIILTLGTAVYGTVRTVVREVQGVSPAAYSILSSYGKF